MKRAAIFPLTTLDTYDFDYPKTIDRDVVARAATLDFIRDKANCVFLGPSGVGKTHLANAIGQLACLRGHRVRFVLAADLVNDLVAGQTRNTLHHRLAAWSTPDLLLIDGSATSASTRAAQTSSTRSSTSDISGHRPSSPPTSLLTQGLGHAVSQQRRRFRHRRPPRPQGPARPNHRQLTPLGSGGLLGPERPRSAATWLQLGAAS